MVEHTFQTSCAHLKWIFQIFDTRKIPSENLLRGTNCDETLLRDPDHYIPWRTFANLISNASKYLDQEDLRSIGRRTWDDGVFQIHGAIGSLMSQPDEQFRCIYGHAAVFREQFPINTFIEACDNHRLEIRAEMAENAPFCHPFYAIIAGQMEGLTETLGYPRSEITMKAVAGGAIYTIDIPKRGLFSRLLRLHRWLASSRLITLEFARLQERYTSLEQRLLTQIQVDAPVAHERDIETRNYQLIGEHVSDVIWVMNLQGKTTYTSPSITKALGYEHRGFQAQAAIPGPEFERLADAVGTLIRARREGSSRIEIPIRHATGGLHQFHIQLVTNQLGKHRERVVICIGKDVSDTHRLEAELQARASSYQAIMDSAPDAILTFGEDFVITYANPATTDVFGYSHAQIIGLSLKALLPETLAANQLHALYHRDTQTALAGIEMQGIRKDRSLVPVEVSISSQDVNGQLMQTCIARDIGSRKRGEQERADLALQLQASQKMESIGQLSGGIAHDFNNLLIAILGYADLAKATKKPENLEKYLTEIKRAGERGTEMTQKLLTFSRQQAIEPELVDALTLLTGVHEMINRLLPENIDIQFRCDQQNIHLFADATQIEQVLINLAVNARDAMPSGGTITINIATAVKDQVDYALIEVSDTGIGMDDDLLAHVFEPFYTTKPEGSGTGLGLAVVFGIIEQHHGKIEVASQLGTGTTFSIFIPLAIPEGSEAGGPAAGGPQSAKAAGAETILIIEDNTQVRDLAHLILSGAGYSVIEADDGAAGVAMYREHAEDIDLVLMDVIMPKMGGQEAAEKIQSEFGDARIAFTSGYAPGSPQTRFIDDNQLPLIPKPYGTAMLRAQVGALLDVPSMAQVSTDTGKKSLGGR